MDLRLDYRDCGRAAGDGEGAGVESGVAGLMENKVSAETESKTMKNNQKTVRNETTAKQQEILMMSAGGSAHQHTCAHTQTGKGSRSWFKRDEPLLKLWKLQQQMRHNNE